MDYKKTPGKELKNYGRLVNKEKTIISIITPFYNSGGTIEETANSILNQTYPFFEWIIVDDGSKDKTLEVIKELASKDERVKYISFSRNFGKEIAMIAGLVISVGISLLRAFLDKKMRYNEEMTMIGDIPILAAIPKFDAVNKSNKKKDKRESV